MTIHIVAEPGVRATIQARSRGRFLVVDYFASRRCGAVVGDLTAGFRDAPPGAGFVELHPIEGVRLFADGRLIGLLSAAGPSLRVAGLPFARHLAVRLDRPELWMEFLDLPLACAGKRREQPRVPRDGPG